MRDRLVYFALGLALGPFLSTCAARLTPSAPKPALEPTEVVGALGYCLQSVATLQSSAHTQRRRVGEAGCRPNELDCLNLAAQIAGTWAAPVDKALLTAQEAHTRFLGLHEHAGFCINADPTCWEYATALLAQRRAEILEATQQLKERAQSSWSPKAVP